MKQSKSILDEGLEQMRRQLQSTFLKSWDEKQFKTMRGAIANHFSGDRLLTLRGNYPLIKWSFDGIDRILGLAYTSSSSYAGFWVCNTEAYNPKYPGYKYVGFALNKDNKAFGILWDEEENEIIIGL